MTQLCLLLTGNCKGASVNQSSQTVGFESHLGSAHQNCGFELRATLSPAHMKNQKKTFTAGNSCYVAKFSRCETEIDKTPLQQTSGKDYDICYVRD